MLLVLLAVTNGIVLPEPPSDFLDRREKEVLKRHQEILAPMVAGLDRALGRRHVAALEVCGEAGFRSGGRSGAASERMMIAMRAAVFEFRIVLSDETPKDEEPTMSLRVYVMPCNSGLNSGCDMLEVHALCPADLQYCSKHN